MLLRTLLLLPVAFFLTGCATDSHAQAPAENNIDSDGNRISSVPWNKPESWETTGSLGGMTR